MKKYILLLLVVMVPVAWVQAEDSSAAEKSRELAIKAAFIYSFIQFVEWPTEKTANTDEPFRIIVINPEGYENIFRKIQNKKISERDIVVEMLTVKNEEDLAQCSQNETLNKCHVLFFCNIDKDKTSRIMRFVEGYPVLVIAQHPGVLDEGVMINFINEEKKVRFEVNVVAVNKGNLAIRSKLLKLARRVITEKNQTSTDFEGNFFSISDAIVPAGEIFGNIRKSFGRFTRPIDG